MSIDARILEIARPQDGVFTAAQAIAVDATYAHLARRTSEGVYQRVVRGGYLAGGVALTWRRRVRVLCLVTGAVACGRTAAVLWGLEPFKPGPTDLGVSRGRRTRGVRTRQVVLRPCDVRDVDGIPVTSVERTLCDLAAVVPSAKLQVAVDSALRLRLTTTDALREAVIASRGRPGAAKIRGIIEVLGPRPVGAPPRELCALLKAAGLPLPELEYPVMRPDGRMAYLDGAYPPEGVAIEIDDYGTHGNPRAMDDDRERETELGGVLDAWRWVRITPRHIRRRAQWVANTLADALGLDPANHQLPAGYLTAS